MNPLHHNIIIKYHFSELWFDWEVSIRVMLECSMCNFTHNSWNRQDLLTELNGLYYTKLKLNMCKGLNNNLEFKQLYEPQLMKHVLHYVFPK